MSAKNTDTVFHACLLVVGPEPLSLDDRIRGQSAPTLSRYKAEVEQFFSDTGQDIDAWGFIRWQRRMRHGG